MTADPGLRRTQADRRHTAEGAHYSRPQCGCSSGREVLRAAPVGDGGRADTTILCTSTRAADVECS